MPDIVPSSQFNALANIETASTVLAANLGDTGLSVHQLPQIQVPGAGGTAWTIETLTGEEVVKELEAIIIHKQPHRVLFLGDFDGSNEAPDCSSKTGVVGVPKDGVNPITLPGGQEITVGGECRACPLAQWGSDLKGGKGQACKLRNSIFLLLGDEMLPTVLDLPPSSLKKLTAYMIRLSSAGLSFYSVVTKMTLNKVQSGSGINYSEVSFAMAGKLDEEAVANVNAYREAILSGLGG